ncbi:MAG TPA: GNAT family N-acetyltransferase [Chthonomonadaceae bacterium]|nr:GNAT family N-acetyltransferase [Chthonomonadaceae bacterium]
MRLTVVTHHLEMTSPSELRPSPRPHPDLRIEQVRIPCPDFNRFLYTVVGKDWHWTDRLVWTDAQWESYVRRPEVQTWVGYVQGAPAGYYELEKQLEDSVEIAYFGLLPAFIGKGIGGHLLSRAVECAWQMGARRVWVHTCSLDHPAALSNYQARGFRIFQTVTEEIPTGTAC